ncbi:MAG: hypothetical protein ACOYA9_11865 [Bilifractor sp.]|jgi:hypothetical protein
MYAVSEKYKAAMKQPVQHFSMRGSIGDIYFSDENILAGSCQITNQCSDDTIISIGQVYIGQMDITLMNLDLKRYSLKGEKITPFFGLKLSDGKYEYIPLGVFNISEAQWAQSGVVIKAYDNLSLFDKTCSVGTTSGKPYELAKMACESCKVPLATTEDEFKTFANGSENFSLYSENDIETWRDYLSWLSAALGCFVTCDRAGRIKFCPYSQSVVDTIDESHRFSGGSFSDFETRYTGISCVNINDKTTSYYGLEEDNGLTYNLGSNPFLQYGVAESLEKQRRAILTSLQQIDYVPFKVTMIGNPAYDLGDVLSFTGGIGDADKLFCITKYTLKYNGSYEIQGVGQDPSLASAKSKSDKTIAGLISSQTDNDMHYVLYQNAEAVKIDDGKEGSVMSVKFAVQKTTHISFDMEILLSVDTTEGNDAGNVSEADAYVKATYYLNGDEISTRHPVETFQDGEHILRLRYELEAVEASIHTWNVVLSVKGGSVSIVRYGVLGVVSGMGLAGNGEWDGEITTEDTIDRILISRIMSCFSDTVDIRLLHDTPCLAADRVARVNIASIFGGFAETVEPTSDIMVFSPWANADKVATSCEVKDNGWIGSGSTTLKTSLSVTTCAVYGAKHITAESKNAIFYISFDGGSTWMGYAENEWKENVAMTESDIGEIPEDALKQYDHLSVKAVLENDSVLYAINLYGGRIQ